VQKKHCSKCGIEYPATAEYFHKQGRNSEKLRADCKVCFSRKLKEYNEAHKQEKQEYHKKYHAMHREEQRVNKQRWRENNREKRREQGRRYYAKHSAKLKEKHRQWRKNSPQRMVVHAANYKARKRSAMGTHTEADIEAQFKRQKGHCYYCKCRMTKVPYQPNSATVDHIVPLDRGGLNDPSNLVIAFFTCNSSKGNKLPHEWVRGGRLI